MALTKEVLDDKIEVVSEYKHLQIRQATVIKEDGKEINRSYSRRRLTCGRLEGSGDDVTFADTDISKETAEIKAVAAAVWTTSVKNAWKAWLLANP